MKRQTSIEAYHAIKENGLLGQRQAQVYRYLFHNGPATAREMTKDMLKQGENSGNLATRLSELRDRGVVKEVGKKVDPETGRRVLLWDVTKNIPVKFEKVKKEKCKLCNGTGFYTPPVQARMF